MGRVLVLCEFSGTVRDAFSAKGHHAVSVDLLPSETPGKHLIMDAQAVLDRLQWGQFDLVIAHPPCTYLANSGVRWLKSDPERWEHMRAAGRFFSACLRAAAPRVAVENPVMHRYGRDACGVDRPDFTVQPWQFGDNERKRTCFWAVGLPALVPTSDLDGSTAGHAVHRAPPGPDRWKERSRTFKGLATAMADQWGPLLP